jgi:DNA end-binding protein Ku
MPRAIWSGSISFGLVNIPVQLFNAVSRKSVRFNQIDTRNNARVRHKKVNAESGEDVPDEAIAKGYELSKGSYVLLSEDELAALDPEAQRTIDIEEFVDLGDIDPVYFDSSYHLAPDPATVKAYALLARTMEQAEKVGIARFVMRQKQYLAAIRPVDGHLVLSTLVYEDEVNPADEVPELDRVAEVDVSEKELAMAEQLVESLAGEWNPEKYHDTHRQQVMELIEAKAAGKEPVVAAELPAREKVVDLMAALEASVAEAKASRGRHPTSASPETVPAKKKPAAKRAAPAKKKCA